MLLSCDICANPSLKVRSREWFLSFCLPRSRELCNSDYWSQQRNRNGAGNPICPEIYKVNNGFLLFFLTFWWNIGGENRLMLAARSEKALEEVTSVCRKLGSECHYMTVDVNIAENCRFFIPDKVIEFWMKNREKFRKKQVIG